MQQQQRRWLEDRKAYANKVAEPAARTRGAGDLYNEDILEYTEQRIEKWIQTYGDSTKKPPYRTRMRSNTGGIY